MDASNDDLNRLPDMEGWTRVQRIAAIGRRVALRRQMQRLLRRLMDGSKYNPWLRGAPPEMRMLARRLVRAKWDREGKRWSDARRPSGRG